MAHWKALEFRTFLHYISVVVLKRFLPSDIYEHFLLFFCGITICSSKKYLNDECLNLANTLLETYVEYYRDIYGEDFITSNVHNLTHVVDDVKYFGILSSISTYPFETMLYQIKTLVRTGNKPLIQVAKRIMELTNISYNSTSTKFSPIPVLEKQVFEINPEYFIKLPFLSHGTQFYEFIRLENFVLINDDKNKWFLTQDNKVVRMKYALKKNDKVILMGFPLTRIEAYFEKPINSKYLDIYVSHCQENDLCLYQLHEVKCKLVCVKDEPAIKSCVFIPLLHTL